MIKPHPVVPYLGAGGDFVALPGGRAISSPTGNITSSTISYTATFNVPFGFRHVFIQTSNNDIGYVLSNVDTGPLGNTATATYMIENRWLYKCAGSSAFPVCTGPGCYGTTWTWTPVRYVPPTVNGYTYTWTINVSDLDAEGSTQNVAFEGDGYAPTVWSPSSWMAIRQQ